MNLNINLMEIDGEPLYDGLPDGVIVEYVTDRDMGRIYNRICQIMPANHTVFKCYNARRKEWIVEICDSPRDYKTRPVWTGVFKKAFSEDADRLITLAD